MRIRPLLWSWLILEILLWWLLTGSFLLAVLIHLLARFFVIVLLTSFSAWVSGAQRLSWREYLHLWLSETLAFTLFFSFIQLWPKACFERHGPIADTHVILVHGFFCNAGMWFFLQRLLEREGLSTSVVELTRLFGSLNELSALISDEVHRIHQQAPHARVTVVAFSMSGLAARLALVCEQTPDFQLITVNTPHKGTQLAWLAAWLGSVNGRQMVPGSDFLRDLEHSEAQVGEAYQSFWSSHDTIIVPARSAQSGTSTTCYGANGHIYAAIDRNLHASLLQHILQPTRLAHS